MRSQQGHGLVLTLVVIVVMTTALGLLASSLTLGMREVQRELRVVSIVALTDAAMAETMARLAVEENFPGVQEYSFGGGMISSEVRTLRERRVEVVARASFGGLKRERRAEIELTASGPRVLRLR